MTSKRAGTGGPRRVRTLTDVGRSCPEAFEIGFPGGLLGTAEMLHTSIGLQRYLNELTLGHELSFTRRSFGADPGHAGRGRALSRGGHWPRDRAPLPGRRGSRHIRVTVARPKADDHPEPHNPNSQRSRTATVRAMISTPGTTYQPRSVPLFGLSAVPPFPACRSSMPSRAGGRQGRPSAAGGLSLMAVNTMAHSTRSGVAGSWLLARLCASSTIT